MDIIFKHYFNRKTDTPSAPQTRGNFGSTGKAWYNSKSNKFIPVTKPYHTQEVFHHPDKFDLNDDDIRNFYKTKKSGTNPDKDMQLFRNYDDMDWSDEVVHGMHDRGWSRIHHDDNKKILYIGTNDEDHAIDTMKQMIKNNHVSPKHTFQVHLYDYGKEGFNGTLHNINYEQAKNLKGLPNES